jgi:hypothetical protein
MKTAAQVKARSAMGNPRRRGAINLVFSIGSGKRKTGGELAPPDSRKAIRCTIIDISF